jgi:hypothetical protein
MKTLGTLLMVVGGIVLLWAMFIFDTSVDVSGYGRRVVNLGLMDDKRNYIIFSGGSFIIGLILYLQDHNEGLKKNNSRPSHFGDSYFAGKPANVLTPKNISNLNSSPIASTLLISSEPNSRLFKEIDKDLGNDSYKLYLSEKYKITRNDLFQKFVYEQKMYDDLNELLAMLHELEANITKLDIANLPSNADLDIVSDAEKSYLELTSILIRNISSKGHAVSSFGKFPSIRWTISLQNGQTKRISNLEELSLFSNSI